MLWGMSNVCHLKFLFSLPSTQALFVCKGAAPNWMAGWRSILEEHGAQSAAMDGGKKTLQWPADSWPEGQRVHTPTHMCSYWPDAAALCPHTVDTCVITITAWSVPLKSDQSQCDGTLVTIFEKWPCSKCSFSVWLHSKALRGIYIP